MARFALLVRESANRVYADAGARLLVAELTAIAPTLMADIDHVGVDSLGGVEYVVFDADDLHETDRFVVSNLSTTRALFELRADGSLVPQPIEPLGWFDSDLVTIQRYPGKTNEQFTHLLVNVAVAASAAARTRSDEGRAVRLLDPVAGRGSTLNRALTYGFDATGIEVVQADVDQYRAFLTTYLRDHRIKHTVDGEKVRKGPLAGTSRFAIRVRRRQTVEMVRGDCTLTTDLLAGQRFDVVVGDLPYGVQHRSTGKGRDRSPLALLEESLPGWMSVMAKGASIALSWNLRTLGRDDVVGQLADAGLEVVEHPHPFEHVVDRSITRDLVVATR